jgi:hypothetical protein
LFATFWATFGKNWATFLGRNFYLTLFATFLSSAGVPNLVPSGIFLPALPFSSARTRLDLNIAKTNYLLKHNLLCYNDS